MWTTAESKRMGTNLANPEIYSPQFFTILASLGLQQKPCLWELYTDIIFEMCDTGRSSRINTSPRETTETHTHTRSSTFLEWKGD